MGFLLETIQVIGSLIPAVGIIALFYKKQNKVSMYLMLTNIGCLIMNMGYWLVLRSDTYEEAMMAYKMEYIGNVLFYIFFGLFVVSYFTKNVPDWIFYCWAGFELIPLFCLWDERLNPLLFGRISFHANERWGYHYVHVEPGMLYLIRYSLVAFVLLGAVIFSTIWLFKIKIRTEQERVARLIGAEFVIVLALTLTLMGKVPFDIVPISGSCAILAIILSVIRGEFFGIAELGREWAFEQMENAVIVVDNSCNVLDANEAARRMFPELNVLREETLEEKIQKRRSILKKLRLDGFRIENLQLEGLQLEKLPIPVYLHEIFGSEEEVHEIDGRFYEKKKTDIMQNGKPEGFSLMLIDITGQRKLLAQVQEEKERADAANQAKSAFMSNMSHEIRTPMNAIVGMTEILLRGELSRTQKEYMENIQRSGNALLGIINDILDFSKIESGKMEIIEDNYAPLAMLGDLKMILKNRIGSKRIKLIYDVDIDLPAKLYGDELRLRQVLINLANNAIKFTDEGHVKLSVKMEEVQGDTVKLRFAVEDTGQGIAPEDINKLFGKFEQVDKKKNHYKEGTGLGLSISRQLVEMMGGEIGVNSEYGKGSEFFFTVIQKVTDSRRAIEVSEEYRTESENVLNFTAPDARILIVDDNEMNRKVALGLLEPLNMQMDTAEDGKQALEKIREHRYDVIFMDHMMPVMDGIEATKALRAMEEEYFKNVPVIALTANAVVEARAQFTDAGMNDFVSKPIEIKDICAKLKTWLPKHLICESETEVVAESCVLCGEEELPDIEGLNVCEGIRYSGTKELFFSLLADFYKLIDMKTVKMEKCLADGMIRDYTIEVHALKNTARMIGAMELSELCLHLEQCGNAEDVETLTKETPKMLALYRSYKEILRPYAQLKTGEKKEMPAGEILAKLRELRDAMDNFDLDGADAAMDELETYRFAEECEPWLEELRAYMADVAMENVMAAVDKLAEYIEKHQEEQQDA
ncbi:MAG: response regulator [Lachnospiraceae bacterium]|nr:response regulator [Lachnospiraceae bacterium]